MRDHFMDQEDKQVIDMVNAKNAPCKEADVMSQQKTMDAEETITKEIAMLRVADANRRRKRQNILSAVGIVLCTAVAAALLFVMENPHWLVWLVNIGVTVCCTAAGIIADHFFCRGRV